MFLRVRPLDTEEIEKGMTSLCEIGDDGVSVTVWPPDPSEVQAAAADTARERAAFEATAAEACRTPSRRGGACPPSTMKSKPPKSPGFPPYVLGGEGRSG